MNRRTFLYASMSAGAAVLFSPKGHSATLAQWQPYNSDRFEAARAQLLNSSQRWIEVDLRRMQVTAYVGNKMLMEGNRLLRFTCDDGDIHNPTITGHFTPDTTAPVVAMSGRRALPQGYKEYQNVETYFVIFFQDGYALHGMDPSYSATGSHVSSGCIRLNFDDARLLYNAHQMSPFQSVLVGYSIEQFPGRLG